MKKKFYVVELDTSGPMLSWDSKVEKGQQFDTEAKALKRAKDLASRNPNVTHEVVCTIQTVICTVNSPTVTKSTP